MRQSSKTGCIQLLVCLVLEHDSQHVGQIDVVRIEVGKRISQQHGNTSLGEKILVVLFEPQPAEFVLMENRWMIVSRVNIPRCKAEIRWDDQAGGGFYVTEQKTKLPFVPSECNGGNI